MIAAKIGRTFLKSYNEKYKKEMTAKQFFINEFVPLFYGGSKYMQWITNSPFVQGISSSPKGEYGVREKLKGNDGKTKLFSSDSEAVKYFKENIQTRSDFLYCLLPKFEITNKAIEYLSSVSFSSVDGFKNIIIDSQYDITYLCEQNEEKRWRLSDIGIREIRKQRFNCKEEALTFFSEEFVQTKGYFHVKDNKKISSKGIEFIKTLNVVERKKLLNDFISKAEKAANKNEYDGSIAIGFPASEVEKFQVASGQVSDLGIKYFEDDIFLSWIGNGLAIGVAGGFSIFFDDCDILLSLYEGWKAYRDILNDPTIKIVGNQIDTWNGQWIAFANSRYYHDDYDYTSFNQYEFFKTENNILKLDTILWSKVLFELSNNYNHKKIIGNVFTYGDTNKTLGFYPFLFKSASTIKSFYKKLFGEHAAIQQAKDYEKLFGIHIKRACELGSFGLHALEPKDLRKYYGDTKNLKLLKPKVNPKKGESEEAFGERKQKAFQKDYENLIHYKTYKTWLLAMITKNKEESLEYTKEVAEALHAYRSRAKKTDRINLIQKDLLAAKSKKAFIDALVRIVEDTKADINEHDLNDSVLDIYKTLRDRVHMMNSEDFGYFVVLLKFDYAYVERELNQ